GLRAPDRCKRMTAANTGASSMSDILLVETKDAVQRVTLNRPDRLNALDQPMANALLAPLESLRRKEEIRVVILSGTGRAFCSGADLKAGGTPEALQDG